MKEMPKQFSPEAGRETVDSYSDWTESQRISEYAHTGEPQYLTPKLARKMKVSPDVMQEVPGASQQDISDSEEWHTSTEAVVDEEIDSLLKPFGADWDSLESKNMHEQFRALLDAAAVRVSDTISGEGFNKEAIREEAIQRMFNIALKHQESMYRLFEVLQLDSPKGLRDIGVVEQLIAYLKAAYEKGSQHARAALYELLDISERMLEMEFHPQVNYLSAERLSQLLRSESGKETLKSDIDMYAPFEITDGVYAVFSSDADRIFVADEEMSNDIKKIIKTGWTREYRGKEGHNLPSYKYEYIPEDLMYSIDGVIDAGTSLDEMALEIGITDPNIVTDYITTLRSSSREIIETKFGFRLTSLTIKEQLYFLSYLKNITMEQADTMQRFTSLYGIDGMRTFLSLERGDETLGDHIIAFGQYDEVAGTIFQYYGELLNNSEQAEALVKEAGCEGVHCKQLAEQVRKNIINRAQKDLETAVRAHDPGEVTAKIETYIADAKVYVALLQEAIQQPLEAIPAAEISEDDKEQMRALSARNYVNESEDFQEVIRSGLESALASGNTRFYIERDNLGKVIFFDRFDDKVDVYNERTVKYFGSVNADPAFNGIGRVRIIETLEQELVRGETMFAHCDPENVVSSLYIEHGFVATGTVSPAGKFSFEIWRSSDSSQQLRTKNLSTSELLEQLEGQIDSSEYEIRKVESGDRFPELNEGKYLTRYFRHGGEYYAVFEPAPAVLEAEFRPPQEQKKSD